LITPVGSWLIIGKKIEWLNFILLPVVDCEGATGGKTGMRKKKIGACVVPQPCMKHVAWKNGQAREDGVS
jgi:hypothetical protein